jgi:hypothetical protein
MYWGARGHATNLNTILGSAWTDTVAYNAGDIVGTGNYNGLMEAFELIRVKAAGAWTSTHYVESHDNVLAASAVHAPVTEPAAHGFASVGHGPG